MPIIFKLTVETLALFFASSESRRSMETVAVLPKRIFEASSSPALPLHMAMTGVS